jgi:multidrug efflux system membrane fusion protein
MRPTIYVPSSIARAIVAEKVAARDAARAARTPDPDAPRARTVVVTLASLARAPRGGAPPTPAADSAMAIAVRLAPVERATVAEPVRATGVLAAKDEVALGFTTAGVVATVTVDEGDRIRAGQTLATLDLATADAQLARARSAADQAERELARAERLHADSVVTRAQLDATRTAAEVARADVRAASFVRRTAAIVAPSSGVVLRRVAEPSAVVAAGQPVLVVRGDADGVVLRVGLADRDAVRVRVGDAATVRFAAHPGVAFRGRVAQVGAGALAGTGTYEVEVAVDAQGRVLASGLVGEVEVTPSRGEEVALVPVEAIIEGDADSAQVYSLAADGRTARRHAVQVAWLRGGTVAIRSGLDGVTRVVTDGVAYLGDGTPVLPLADATDGTPRVKAGRQP